jgi:hypothetical protein
MSMMSRTGWSAQVALCKGKNADLIRSETLHAGCSALSNATTVELPPLHKDHKPAHWLVPVAKAGLVLSRLAPTVDASPSRASNISSCAIIGAPNRMNTPITTTLPFANSAAHPASQIPQRQPPAPRCRLQHSPTTIARKQEELGCNVKAAASERKTVSELRCELSKWKRLRFAAILLGARRQAAGIVVLCLDLPTKLWAKWVKSEGRQNVLDIEAKYSCR